MSHKCKVGAVILPQNRVLSKLVSSMSARRRLKPLKFIVAKGSKRSSDRNYQVYAAQLLANGSYADKAVIPYNILSVRFISSCD